MAPNTKLIVMLDVGLPAVLTVAPNEDLMIPSTVSKS